MLMARLYLWRQRGQGLFIIVITPVQKSCHQIELKKKSALSVHLWYPILFCVRAVENGVGPAFLHTCALFIIYMGAPTDDVINRPSGDIAKFHYTTQKLLQLPHPRPL